MCAAMSETRIWHTGTDIRQDEMEPHAQVWPASSSSGAGSRARLGNSPQSDSASSRASNRPVAPMSELTESGALSRLGRGTLWLAGAVLLFFLLVPLVALVERAIEESSGLNQQSRETLS